MSFHAIIGRTLIRCFGALWVLLGVCVGAGAAPPPEKALSDRLVEVVKVTVQAALFRETWEVPASEDGRDRWMYTRSVDFGDEGKGTVIVSRRHSRTEAVEEVRQDEFTYDFEDRMVPELNPGIESIRLRLRAPKVYVQRDGSRKTVATELEYRPSITWHGFDTEHTDTDDLVNMHLERSRSPASAPAFAIEGLESLDCAAPTDDEHRKDFQRGLRARRQWWLCSVQETPEFKALCLGEFGAQDEHTASYEANTRVRVIVKEAGELRLEYHRNEPASWVNRKNVHKVFDGTLVDIQRETPSDEFALSGFAHINGRQLQATESLTLIYLDLMGRSRAIVCCHFDAQAGVRYAKFVILNKTHDLWTADEEWWTMDPAGVGAKGQALPKKK